VSLGEALEADMQIERSFAIYREAARCDPAKVQLWHQQGVEALSRQELVRAESLLRRAAYCDAALAVSLVELGDRHFASGSPGDALRCYRYATEANANLASAHNGLGVALRKVGEMRAVIAAFRRALDLDPDLLEAGINLGAALCELGETQEALAVIRVACARHPGNSLAQSHLGLTLISAARFEEGERALGAALAATPTDPSVLINAGLGWRKLGRDDEAEACFRRAAGLAPQASDPVVNLASLWARAGRFREAADLLEEALRSSPADARLHVELGVQLAALGQHREALNRFDSATALVPEFPSAQLNRGVVKLALGEYNEGWPLYEWRWRADHGLAREAASMTAPRWHREPLEGRTVLLVAEQGLGDTLQFVRYATLVARAGGRVVLECQAPLVRLLQHVEGVERVVPVGQRPAYDTHCSLLSLPLLFGSTVDTIPNQVPYLRVPEAITEAWRKRLPRRGGLRVGIAWSGNPDLLADRRRSIPLAEFAPLGSIEGIELYSLQKGAGSAELRSSPRGLEVIDLTARLDDFLDTAGLLLNLDLVISVDTSVAHLAGALAKPVWLLSRSDGCWRWLLEREDSPWYPSLRVFRQQTPMRWRPVIEKVAEELTRLAQSETSPRVRDRSRSDDKQNGGNIDRLEYPR
jgi:tetratricopeptide (TPR) repeat protein